MKGATLISIVACASDTATREIDVEAVIKAIRTGGKKLKGQITLIRNRFEDELAVTQGDLKKAKAVVVELKNQLPGVLWSGTFSDRANDDNGRASDKLIQHSGGLCADLDNLGERLEEVREKIKASPYLAYLFRSPTDGLKAVFQVPADASKHLASFRAVEKHVLELTGIQIDQACKDVARLCFMSYDPDLYVKENAVEIEPLPEPEKPKSTLAPNGAVNLSERQRIATELLGNIEWESDTSGFVGCPGKHLHTTGDGERDCRVNFDGVPTVYCFHNSCRGILDGVNHELRSCIGKVEYKHQTAPEVAVTNETGEDITSLTSFDLTPYPAPLSQAAFHGLAGQFVKRILPYTESDEAALLFQFQTCFGNVIGRTANMIADAAPHYCNTNMILVGPTSVARKGTAWRHNLRIFGCVDKNWTQNCIKHGVSSGEGIIFHVRDPIEKTVPVKDKGKFTGRYETVTEDPGVQEKRLMIVETEFASVLKVMERSGSTVSVVFRHMWDGDNVLSTLTKNSPVRATGTHGSVLGHITIEELRRLLTATEMANGFGNRFQWIAVRRRQELAENDELPAVADLVQRLHKSIEFAKTAGQLKRDDQARELWASVYHDLSEGKPGLFGAIIARAAPQVLRQSLHYALLDCSKLVRIEHLQAALECWRYCEESARWIFQAGTGNKNADRILAALRAAGRKGLTRLQITSEVFNRNATKFEIDEALRLLHSRKLAVRQLEGTATRPAERWFYNSQKNEEYEESTQGDGQTGDSSYSSCTQTSENSDSGHLDKQSETVIGDELGVARL